MDEQKTPEQEVAQEVPQEQAVAKKEPVLMDGPQNIWNNLDLFKMAYKQAQILASSDLVPEQTYKGKPANCLIALEMAQRMGMSPLNVMQNLFIVKGKPSWSGKFCITAANASGRFSPLEFVQLTDDKGNLTGYFARAARLDNNKVCDGPPVTWQMVKDEGWLDKNGSKWKTMPELMFHYRAAEFFVNTHCPDVLCGLQTREAVQDVNGYESKETTVISFD